MPEGTAMTTRDTAKRRVQAVYREWRSQNPDDDKMLFYAFLTKRYPNLLSFRPNQDRWRDVHAWINQVDGAQ